MKGKMRNIIVGGLSALMLAAIPLASSSIDNDKTPVTATAATSNLVEEQNLAHNKWDWEVDEIASGVTKFDGESMYMDGISSIGGPFATYKTNRLDDFKYSMYANMNLTTAYQIDGVESAKEWDYSTFYISFMINYDATSGFYPLYARPWDGPAYFSICFEKQYLEYNYCPDCGINGRALKVDSETKEMKCPVCKGTNYETKGRLMDVIRLYRNECFDGRGWDRVTLVEKRWYEGVENDIGKDFDYNGKINKKDIQTAQDIGVPYADGNYHWFDFEVKNNAANNGIVISFYYDNVLFFEYEQLNSFVSEADGSTSLTQDKQIIADFSGTTGYLGFWTDSSFPDLNAERTNCFVDVKQLGIAPIVNGNVGAYYTQAPKPDLPITAKTYRLNASYAKGEEMEIPLSELFSYEGDEEILYTFVDNATGKSLGEVRNGYWLWTPLTGSRTVVKVTAVVQDGTNAKTANQYLVVNLSGDDITATQLDAPIVRLDGNVASWTSVANAGGYVYKIGQNGEEIVATSNSITLKHNETLYVKAKGVGINCLDSSWSAGVTFVAKTLGTPLVKLSGTTASWAAIDGAEGYRYKINGGDVQTTSATSCMGLTHNQSIEVQAIGNGVTTLDSAWSYPVTYKAEELTAPVVTLDGNKAKWNAISGANGYVYKIGESGEEMEASEMFVSLTHNQTIYVKAKGNGATSLDSKWSRAITYQATMLATPVVNLLDNKASWSEISGASAYVYKIGASGEEITASELFVILEHNQTIYVKAIGDGVVYLDSAWSTARTYNEGAWNQPALTLVGNKATWTEVVGVSQYVYSINGVEGETSVREITLSHGETLKVKAVGGGKEDSLWSNAVTYVAPKLETPVITLDGKTASWATVANASGYVYKIGVNGTEKTASEFTVSLEHNQKLYVKAVGDNETYLDSDWAVSQTYQAPKLNVPTVSLNGNVVTWTVETAASGCVYKIGLDGQEHTASKNGSVTLIHNQTVYVKAKGDNKANVDSDWVAAQTYVAPKLATPEVSLNGNVASWTKLNAASSYVYKIGATGEVKTATESYVLLEDNQTLYIKAVGDNETMLDSDWSQAITYRLPTLDKVSVSLNGNVASWTAVNGASGYIYSIDGGAEQETSSTSVALTAGQSIVVKAKGNNTTSKDGEWSDEVTYAPTGISDDNTNEVVDLDGIYEKNDHADSGCKSVVSTYGIVAMLVIAGVCLAVKRRGEDKQ